MSPDFDTKTRSDSVKICVLLLKGLAKTKSPMETIAANITIPNNDFLDFN